MRNQMKPTNFGLPYGISYVALSEQIGKSEEETKELMKKHELTFPTLWEYLRLSGSMARLLMKSYDMYGRRRIFPVPSEDLATKRALKYQEQALRLPEEEAKRNIEDFSKVFGRKPTPEERLRVTHFDPSQKQINSAIRSIYNGIERQGKNHRIQGTNASIAKLAMGAGYCPDGKPYLWHTLRTFKARLVKFVHDELVVQAPRRFGEEVAALIGDAFKRAAAERMTQVVMEFEYAICSYWSKG
jgi:DNA polymerase I-like protein with 3'-5' exonuclease and polymerase domains